ncbi:winged helix-turn-helix transcriptional regulator [Hoeflea prorocentri]|uniref:Helix-turn-helix domain-containing protein n=1 Tax=Hoeflea prorocentri TaxID=1922333 RepID=A0A9X3UMN7_9HYPH|nr:helix-turn-helix domain-containing protein [Hoeflea prorocentri]MCY6382009.1 helix-turn-helix domain-containing protein [Hoeflea prorocentri]MDA5399809.1 helix-turn-helix domain-containing protein [Hoeflea prorocentri]
MKSYGQFCPVAKAAELFCERWNALIVRDLAAGPRRFSELQRGVPLMSPSLLSSRLKWLIDEGVVERRGGHGRQSAYALTEAGREFVPLVEALGIWGQRWTRRQLKEHEIDLGLLVWSLESSTNPQAFGDRRCLIRLELTDQVASKRLWWFLNQKGRCELCVDDPGGGVNLYLSCTLPDIIYLVRGDLTPALAISDQRLEVIGDGWARKTFVDWLNLSPLAQVQSNLDVH